MKTTKFFSALLTLTILLGVLALPAAASQDIKVVLNGQELKGDVTPVIVDGRVLLPMRTVAEAMGCSVEWDDHFQRVIVQTNAGWEGWVEEYYVDEAQLNWDGMLTLRNRYNLRIFIYVDENFAYIYDDTWSSYYDPMLAPFVFPEDPPTVFGTDVKRIPLDVTPRIIDDRVMVPLRFVAEALHCEVKWLAETGTVVITGQEVLRLPWQKVVPCYAGYEVPDFGVLADVDLTSATDIAVQIPGKDKPLSCRLYSYELLEEHQPGIIYWSILANIGFGWYSWYSEMEDTLEINGLNYDLWQKGDLIVGILDGDYQEEHNLFAVVIIQ